MSIKRWFVECSSGASRLEQLCLALMSTFFPTADSKPPRPASEAEIVLNLLGPLIVLPLLGYLCLSIGEYRKRTRQATCAGWLSFTVSCWGTLRSDGPHGRIRNALELERDGWHKDEEAGATLGPHSVVLPASTLGAHATVGPASLVMRGETVPVGSRWSGNPIGPWRAVKVRAYQSTS